ncbi:hypothetical protein ACNKHK_25820 [Shigella flexneri]
MKIIAADVFVTCPGRNFVTLKITTESGLCGLGDATLNGRELSVASYLKDYVSCGELIGRDVIVSGYLQFFYKGAYGVVVTTMSAISAVDMALWDIKRKQPICRCTSHGGASREGVMVDRHTTGHTVDDVLDLCAS